MVQYHIFKQHYGFMMMYKKKNRDFLPVDTKLDKIFFASAFYYPFITYPLHSKVGAAQLPFPLPRPLVVIGEPIVLSAVILITLVYVSRQVQRWWLGLPLNWLKLALPTAAIPVNYLLFQTAMPLVGVFAAVTIYHNIQYHRLVWFYNQNKYGHETSRSRKYGLATLINRRWMNYVAAAAIYATIFDVIPRFVLKGYLGLMPVGLRNHLIFYIFAAPGLLHYWLDGHIWKLRSDPELRTYLQLERA